MTKNNADPIAFNRPPLVGRELQYVEQALAGRVLAGDGPHTKICHDLLQRQLGAPAALLTHSCTAALELAALLCGLEPGDEVIMPSFTFVSTANAVVLRRAVPVFVDIRSDTFNIDENLVEAAIGPRTRAIFAVHYAGVCAEMDKLKSIADRHGLKLVEDAAQALGSTYRGRPAGVLGDIGCFSFHETKNVVSGEGGALVLSSMDLAKRARILWEKGTNRADFLHGLVDKYTWVDVGSSFLPNEITAAVLRAQLERADMILADRLATWRQYHSAFEGLEAAGHLRRPIVPAHCGHNGHIYAVLLKDLAARIGLISGLRADGIHSAFHYVPLHSSPAGRQFGRVCGLMTVTEDVANRLLRLPIWYDMADLVPRVVERVSVRLKQASLHANG